MDHFKFELIRASAAQEITHSRSTKFAAVTAAELVEAFADFALGCGYQRESLADAFAEFTDDEPQQYCLEAMDPPEVNSKPTPNPNQIRSSLVQRISRAICYAQQRDETGSRAAIREVAAWLRDSEGDYNTIRQLEMQADTTITSQENSDD
jgi:hypothetical protein